MGRIDSALANETASLYGWGFIRPESKKTLMLFYGQVVRALSWPRRASWASVSAPRTPYVFTLWLSEGKDTKAVLTWMQKHPKTYFLGFNFGNGYFVLTDTLSKQMNKKLFACDQPWGKPQPKSLKPCGIWNPWKQSHIMERSGIGAVNLW